MARVMHAVSPIKGAPHVFIATPSTNVCGNYSFAIAQGIPKVLMEDIAADYCLLMDNCHVDDARNTLVRKFLMTECTDLIFIDSDVGFRPDDLVRLCKYGEDIVAGVYPFKSPKEEGYPIRLKPGVPLQAQPNGLVPCEGLPTGFMKIRRHVLEAMYAQSVKFYGRADDKKEIPHGILFERTCISGERMSGDYAFCEKAKKMGYQLFVDPEMAFSHEGSKEWYGSIGEYWKEAHGVNAVNAARGFEVAMQNLKAGKFEFDDALSLYNGWGNHFAASYELLVTCHDMAKEAEGPILETGSGLSSIVMALANPAIKIHCLEHDPFWASKTNQALVKYGISNVIIHCHALKDYGGYMWYDVSDVPAVDFSLVLCDGPPRNEGSRKGLFEHCSQYIKNAPVIMDDANDEGQLNVLKLWSKSVGRSVGEIEGSRKFAISYKQKEREHNGTERIQPANP